MDRIKVILDTDMGSDCDDAGALSLLHKFANEGKTDILCVTHCSSNIGGAVTVRVINEWYGKSDIPIGRYTKRKFLEDEVCKRYTKPVSEEYLKCNPMPKLEDAVTVLRRALSKNADVTLISIGTLNNIRDLLISEADEISDLSGYDLVRKNVRELYVMGGDFEDLSHGEYNIACDIEAAKYVSENFPKTVIYCGFEIGVKVITGKCFKGTNSPMEKIYSISTDNALRESWDPITVFCAVEKDSKIFKVNDNLTITFNDDATVKIKKGGKDGYIELIEYCDVLADELEKNMY